MVPSAAPFSSQPFPAPRLAPRARLPQPLVPLALAAAAVQLALAAAPLGAQDPKPALDAAIESRADQYWQIAEQIWNWAEPGYQEVQSAPLLADTLQAAGFRLNRAVADIPTAFLAEIGSGQPVIGLLAEYDALPGLSQQAVPERSPRVAGGYGHACGHHLFGTAVVAAGVALAEPLSQGQLHGTLRIYGCPAEEGGAAKVFLARAGLFSDCAAVLHWHPSDKNSAGDGTCLARVAAKFRFHGTSSHAASAPEQGRSALDAVELTNFAAQLLREHTPDFTRIHHVITHGGGAPNVVPEFAEVYYYVRHPDAQVARQIYDRLLKCAQAGALATETRLEIQYLGGTWQLLPNQTLAALAEANLRALANLEYSTEEQAFAARIQATLARPQPLDSIGEVHRTSGHQRRGSTDVGDVSWVVPTTGFTTACWVPGTPGHSWQAVAAGGMSIGRQGMLLAARTMAATACDLFTQPSVLAAARDEFDRRAAEHHYAPLLEPDQKPPLDYRRSSQGETPAE